ncbi:hypothetical protein [Nocardia transvalensis]|uniref:hypothetical protein n=1 Tax=Nocardia transvalensis TaxID=37333 RepID=UPI0018941FD5|nr:hypothetical protein [Nocardia transvalensis]MBF6331892.1 hypothetical protein [Nocardia transvalensis]
MRRFDTVISNPPFGRATRTVNAPGYRGPRFEYHAIAVSAQVARRGVFLLPQSSAPFRYSGRPGMEHDHADEEYRRFHTSTGITLEPSCGIDPSQYREHWHQPAIETEVVTCDFETANLTLQRRRASTVISTRCSFARPGYSGSAAA